jgi:excisionase family DNA binding protein
MDAIVFTQLSIPEIRQLLRQELQTFFDGNAVVISKPESDELLTIKQAAEFLKLSVPTVYGLVSKDRVPVNKRSKRLYFSKQELTNWIKTGKKQTKADIEAKVDAYLQSKVKRG